MGCRRAASAVFAGPGSRARARGARTAGRCRRPGTGWCSGNRALGPALCRLPGPGVWRGLSYRGSKPGESPPAIPFDSQANALGDRSAVALRSSARRLVRAAGPVFPGAVRRPHAQAGKRPRRMSRTRGSHERARARPPSASRFKGETPLSKPRVRRAVTVGLGVLGLALLLFVSGARVMRQDVGHVGVVRNGGPLDNRSIRQILMPGSGVTWAGWFSQRAHEYPARSVVLLYTI